MSYNCYKKLTSVQDKFSCQVKGSELKAAQSGLSLQPRELYRPWNSPGQNTGVGSLSLLQGIFPTQGWNPDLPHCRWILLPAEPQGKPSGQMSSAKTFHFLSIWKSQLQLRDCWLFRKSDIRGCLMFILKQSPSPGVFGLGGFCRLEIICLQDPGR